MLGAVAIVVLVVLVLPPLFLMIGGVLSGVMGRALRRHAEEEHAGREPPDLDF